MGEPPDQPAEQCDLLCLDLPHAERIRASLPDLESLSVAAGLGKAVSGTTRLAIAAALAEGDELCVCDMAWVVGQAQNLTSHHLRQLRAAGLVASRRDGKLVLYRLTPVGRALVGAVLPAHVVVEEEV